MKVLALIPARFASSRFPGKPLAVLGGKTMIQRVCEQVSKAESIDQVAVVTDDERIFSHVDSIGFRVFMSDPNHQSGTDRCAEIAEQMSDFDIIVNVQGDEPFIQPEQIDLVARLPQNEGHQIGTLVKKITDPKDIFNSNVVKAVFGTNGKALYFSRAPMPHLRGIKKENWFKKGIYYKHIGIYSFQRKALLQVSKLKQSRLEKSESLEQLRWLENGFSIITGETEFETIGIDTPEDLDKAEVFLKSQN